MGEQLTIDPSVEYSTFVGTTFGDQVYSAFELPTGEITVGGRTSSPTFPTTPGAFDESASIQTLDAFVLRISSDGSSVIYSTFLGDSTPSAQKERPLVAPIGDETVVLFTSGFSHPVTEGAYASPTEASRDVFIARLNDSGTDVSFMAKIGGYSTDVARTLQILEDESIMFAGQGSSDLPAATKIGLHEGPDFDAGFAMRLSATGSDLLQSVVIFDSAFDTYSIFDAAVLNDGRILFGGQAASNLLPATADAFQVSTVEPTGPDHADAYWMLLDPTWSEIEYASYLSSPSSDDLRLIVPIDNTACWLIFATGSGAIPFPSSIVPVTLGTIPMPWIAFLFDLESHEVVQARWISQQSIEAAALDQDGGLVVATFATPDASFPFLSPGAPFGPPGTLGIHKLDVMGERWVESRAFGGGSGATLPNFSQFSAPHRLVIGGESQAPGMFVTENALDPTLSGLPSLDGFVAIFDLTPDGVTRYGDPVNGCTAECRASIRALPTSGEPDFGIGCIGAPRSTPGALVIGFGATELPLVGGATLLVDPTSAVVLPAFSDQVGRAGLDLPLTTVAPGTTAAFQFVWLDLGACDSVGTTYSSDALSITVQP